MQTIQDIQFELMRRASFNDFDGDYVVNLLQEHRDLWRGAIMERDDLIPCATLTATTGTWIRSI